jgi:hypothetical protein
MESARGSKPAWIPFRLFHLGIDESRLHPYRPIKTAADESFDSALDKPKAAICVLCVPIKAGF